MQTQHEAVPLFAAAAACMPPPPPPAGPWSQAPAALPSLAPLTDPFAPPAAALPPFSDPSSYDFAGDAIMPDAVADETLLQPPVSSCRYHHVIVATECGEVARGFHVEVFFEPLPAQVVRLPQRFSTEAAAARAADDIVRRRHSAPLNFPSLEEASYDALQAEPPLDLEVGPPLGCPGGRDAMALSEDDVAAMAMATHLC
jgi:hypothetical protein